MPIHEMWKLIGHILLFLALTAGPPGNNASPLGNIMFDWASMQQPLSEECYARQASLRTC